MSKNCKNCDHIVDNSYCPKCGQSTSVGRINLQAIMHEFLHGIVHVDKGILYTIRELTLRPGQTIRNYFEGKRVKLFKPFGYLFLLATIYIFLYLFVAKPTMGISMASVDEEMVEVVQAVEDWNKLIMAFLNKHFVLISICTVPFLSIFTMLFFRTRRYNYGEHLVMNSYILGHQMLIYTLLTPFMYIFEQECVIYWTYFLSFFMSIYMMASVFNTHKLWKRILYPLLIQIIYFFGIVLLVVVSIVFFFSDIIEIAH